MRKVTFVLVGIFFAIFLITGCSDKPKEVIESKEETVSLVGNNIEENIEAETTDPEQVIAYTNTEDVVIETDNTIGDRDLVLIDGGEFNMGNYSNYPEHRVIVSSFMVSPHLVSRFEFESIMGEQRPMGDKSDYDNYSLDEDEYDERQVDISWGGPIFYCNGLSESEGLEPYYNIPEGKGWEWPEELVLNTDANGYRILTEAEWEYLASQDLVALGIIDMDKEYYEWVFDRFGPYSEDLSENPIGPDTGYDRVYRGGTVHDRYPAPPFDRVGASIGFRIVRNVGVID